MYWKTRTKIFLLSTNQDVWNCVDFSYHEPTIKIDDQVVIKPGEKWDTTDKKILGKLY